MHNVNLNFVLFCRDAIMINIVSFFTSLYAGFAVFSIIGFMANEAGIDVEKVIDSGNNNSVFVCNLWSRYGVAQVLKVK